MKSNSTPPFELYHPDMLASAREPKYWRKEHEAAYTIEAYNRICGDKFDIRFDIQGIITDTSFYGYGCVVSKASVELLCEMLIGKHPEEARMMMRNYLDALNTDNETAHADPRQEHFMIARKFPGRVQCAALGWEAVLKSSLFSKH